MAFRETVCPKKKRRNLRAAASAAPSYCSSNAFSCENDLETWGGGTTMVARRFNRGVFASAGRSGVARGRGGLSRSGHVVFVVDDDASLRQALMSLLQSVWLARRGLRLGRRFSEKGATSRMLPQPASFLTSGCRASADSIFRPNWPRPRFKSPLFSFGFRGHPDDRARHEGRRRSNS